MKKSLAERLKMAVSVAKSRSPSPEPGPSTVMEVLPAMEDINMPFTDFVVSRLDGQSQKLFAKSYAAQMRVDRHAKVIDLDETLIWLGYTRRDNAIRQLTNLFEEGEYEVRLVSLTGEENRGKGGRPGKQYLISLDQFEEMMIEAGTEEGRTARKMFRQLKDAVFDFIDLEKQNVQRLLEDHQTELEEHKVRTADLAKQVEDLRLSRITLWLYAYRLFENRYKCGFTTDIEARTKQHKTSCPSGYLSHKVVVQAKALEKVMDSVLKAHGNHVTQEEYIFDGGDSQVQLVLNTIARVEESLHSVSFERYEDLLSAVNEVLKAETQTTEHSSLEGQAVSDESVTEARVPQTTLSAALTTMSPCERVVAFIDQHLRLDRDRKDRRDFMRIRALHEYYTKVSRDGVEPLHLGEFTAHIRELLAENWKGGISFRDHYYRGIECV